MEIGKETPLRTFVLDTERCILKVNGEDIPHCTGFKIDAGFNKYGDPVIRLTLQTDSDLYAELTEEQFKKMCGSK